MDRVRVTIDGRETLVPPGTTIINAARGCGVDIPSLCADPRLEPFAACRLCLVEVEGTTRGPVTACTVPVTDGMVVTTETPEIAEQRKVLIDLLLSDHRFDCLVCDQAGACRLQDLAYRYDVAETSYKGERRTYDPRDDNPFIAYDPGKCVLCGRCVGICEQVQGCRVLDFADRGFPSLVTTSFGRSMVETNCELCGNCVSACPTGALQDKKSLLAGRTWQTATTETTCPFCGCGCTIELHVNDGKVVRVTAPLEKGANEGNLCVKGRYGFQFINHPDRLTEPLVRRDGELVPATWDEALDLVAEQAARGQGRARRRRARRLRLGTLHERRELPLPEAHARRSSAPTTSTTARGSATPPPSPAWHSSLGSGAMTNPFADFLAADTILVIGSNTTEAHPIGALYIKRAVRNGARLIVADPREIDLVALRRPAPATAPGHQRRPGQRPDARHPATRVSQTTRSSPRAPRASKSSSRCLPSTRPSESRRSPACPPRTSCAAARMYAGAAAASIVYSMGVTQHSHGTEHVLAVSNLALLTGNLGRPGTGVNPLRGQNNVQGACDMGALPGDYTGYQKVADAAARAKFAAAWGVELPETPGLTVTEAMGAMLDGRIRALFVMGENPMLSDPDITHVEEALRSLDFLVVQDIFLTETARLADVVLPAATFAEKEGTFTNTERKVQRVRKALDAPGEARADWKILVALAGRLGADWQYRGTRQVFDEIATLTPSYAGLSFERLDDEGGLCWPCPAADHPGTPRLHEGSFTRGKGLFCGGRPTSRPPRSPTTSTRCG